MRRGEALAVRRVEQLLTAGSLLVKSMIVEGHGCSAAELHRLQQVHGYEVYLLDMHVDRRRVP